MISATHNKPMIQNNFQNKNPRVFFRKMFESFKTRVVSIRYQIKPTPLNAAKLLQQRLDQRITKPTIQQEFDFICTDHAHDLRVNNPAMAFKVINNTDKVVEIFINAIKNKEMITKRQGTETNSEEEKLQLVLNYLDVLLKIRDLMDNAIKNNQFTTKNFHEYWKLNDQKNNALHKLQENYALNKRIEIEINEAAAKSINKLDPARKSKFLYLIRFDTVFF